MVQSVISLRHQIETQVQTRTGRRVRNLAIEFCPERIVLRGLATSYHVKQLAQQGVREVLPHVSLDNDILVQS